MTKKQTQFNPTNERIKQTYFQYLKEAKQRADTTINGVRKAILRYENYTGFKDFKTFHREQAVAFKKHLSETTHAQTGKPISKSTMLSTINNLKAFFEWLAHQNGYKSKIHIPDIEYLNLSEKETRMAKKPQFKEFPSLETVREVILSMPHESDIEKRDRALLAFAILTGMRDGALASISLRFVDVDKKLVHQDPKSVNTKFSKHIFTFFLPIGDDIENIVLDWINYLKDEKGYGEDAPLFPQTHVGHDHNCSFQAQGITPLFWSSTTPIRKIYAKAFKNSGKRYYNPHLFRDTLVDYGMNICKSPREFKAWSQNLGHESPLTTFTSYGRIEPHKQGEVIREIETSPQDNDNKIDEILAMLKKQ